MEEQETGNGAQGTGNRDGESAKGGISKRGNGESLKRGISKRRNI